MINLKYYILLLSFSTLVFSCKKNYSFKEKERSTQVVTLDSIIASLDSQEKKEDFLISIFRDDQRVRDADKEYEILKKNNFDHNSAAYKELMQKMIVTDSLNFVKTMKYLEKYGFPKFKPTNQLSIYVFNTITMHQPTYEKQLQLFPYLYEAYQQGKIPSDKFSFLLNNMYRHKYNKSYPHAQTDEGNIRQLLEELQLID